MKDTIKKSIKRIIPQETLIKIRDKIYEKKTWKLIDDVDLYRDKITEPQGINFIGPYEQPSGLGQSARIIKQELEHTGIPIANISWNPIDRRCIGECQYTVNIIHANMHDMVYCIKSMKNDPISGRYNIAYWLWELPEFPSNWIPSIKLLDEIWTPTEFVSESIRKITDKPVVTMPYYISTLSNQELTRKDFDLPDNRFLFLMMFDANSCVERKNPQAVIRAYKQAFSKDDNVGLVIKISNMTVKDMERLADELEGYHVYYIEGILPKPNVNRLIELCDAYVSLHRSEGYGLALAEAMLLGTPTIATRYSANLEFQNDTNACLVNCDIIALDRDVLRYKKGNHWADPNIEEASYYMKRLYNDKTYREDIVSKAKQHMKDNYNLENISRNIYKRYLEIVEQVKADAAQL